MQLEGKVALVTGAGRGIGGAISRAPVAENTKYGIKCHLVAPGVTDSSIWDRKEVPLPGDVRARMLEPADVAGAVLFLQRLPHRVRMDRIVLTPNAFPMKLWDYPLLTPSLEGQ